jgi:hypothetical protein
VAKTKWETGEVMMGLKELDLKTKAAILAGAEYTATQGVAYMRSNATWTDQTGAARNGLQAKVVKAPTKVAVVFYHTVDYGVWLEVRWGGKYQIIRPTVQAMAPQFVAAVGRLLF